MQNTERIIQKDIAIIGGGPVGMFGVFQAGMLGLRSCIIDCIDLLGGQCSALYPEKPIYDIPGYHKITAQELITKLEEQISPFQPEIVLGNRVLTIENNSTNIKQNAPDYRFCITTNQNTQIYANAIIIAIGAGAFGPNKPILKNIEKLENKNVLYYIKNTKIFQDKKIVIAGGGDSSIDWALSLSEIASKIYVVHRREKFRCASHSLQKLQQIALHKTTKAEVEFVIPYQLSELKIHPKNSTLQTVIVSSIDQTNTLELDADYLLPFFGLSMNMSEAANWGITLCNNNRGISVNPSSMSTSRNGLYAAGDVASYPGKLKLILTGFSEIALACHSIYKFLHPEKDLNMQHSTSKGIPSL